MTIISSNSLETKEIGRILGKEILAFKNKEAVVINLKGNLGAGKTTFVQGVALGLGIRRKILSPTFIIFNKYKIRKKSFYHIDCYRIDKTKEMEDLGFKEIVKDPNNILMIEWGERIKKILPKCTIEIKFKILKDNKREISYEERNICSN